MDLLVQHAGLGRGNNTGYSVGGYGYIFLKFRNERMVRMMLKTKNIFLYLCTYIQSMKFSLFSSKEPYLEKDALLLWIIHVMNHFESLLFLNHIQTTNIHFKHDQTCKLIRTGRDG